MKMMDRENRRRMHFSLGYGFHACLFLGLSAVFIASAAGFSGYGLEDRYRAAYLKDALVMDSGVVYEVNHDPAGPTLNHDYYASRTDEGIYRLVGLIENAHVNKILPNLKKSFTAPDTLRKGFLKQALREIRYTLGRLVNHPKALALSASVTKLLGRPRLPVSFYQRALAMYPQRAFTWAQYGNYLVGLGEIEQGIERLKIAIKIDPKLSMTYGWLAWAYHKNGDFDLANDFIEKAKEKGFKGKLPKAQSGK